MKTVNLLTLKILTTRMSDDWFITEPNKNAIKLDIELPRGIYRRMSIQDIPTASLEAELQRRRKEASQDEDPKEINQLEPQEFSQVTVRIAEHQPEYQTLPAHTTEDGRVITCFHVTPDQMADMARSGELWVQIYTFGNPLQPLCVHTNNPFRQP